MCQPPSLGFLTLDCLFARPVSPVRATLGPPVPKPLCPLADRAHARLACRRWTNLRPVPQRSQPIHAGEGRKRCRSTVRAHRRRSACPRIAQPSRPTLLDDMKPLHAHPKDHLSLGQSKGGRTGRARGADDHPAHHAPNGPKIALELVLVGNLISGQRPDKAEVDQHSPANAAARDRVRHAAVHTPNTTLGLFRRRDVRARVASTTSGGNPRVSVVVRGLRPGASRRTPG